MKGLRVNMAIVLLLGVLVLPSLCWAAESFAEATISATIPVVATISLARDANSVIRGSTSQVLFDRRDDLDPDVPEPNAGYMYAPYRSETNMNWHIANIIASGSSMILSARVTGTIGSTELSSVMRVWCGGFFTPGAKTPITGTATTDDGKPATDDWEYLNGFRRPLGQPFVGTVPFNYRLDISGLPGGGPYSGTITFTLVSN